MAGVSPGFVPVPAALPTQTASLSLSSPFKQTHVPLFDSLA